MRKRTFLVYVGYLWTTTLLGLTFEPYSSIREIIRRPILVPVIFSPLIGILILGILGRLTALVVTTQGYERETIAIFLGAVFISILLWQLLLFYLLFSFLFAKWRG